MNTYHEMMTGKTFASRAGKLLSGVILSLMFVSCSNGGNDELAWYEDMESLQNTYLTAVEDARMALPEEISRTLPAIVSASQPDDPRQRWMTDEEGREYVLVGSMMSAKSAATYPEDNEELIWVTLPYDLADHVERRLPVCADSLECRMRMLQLLGLPPTCDYDYLVFFHAEADGLFRPTPDPETTDHEASLDFPASATDEYRMWFEANNHASYRTDSPYPWTRLGYTYDWHQGTESVIGPGEFVVTLEAKVKVERRVGVWTWYRELGK